MLIGLKRKLIWNKNEIQTSITHPCPWTYGYLAITSVQRQILMTLQNLWETIEEEDTA